MKLNWPTKKLGEICKIKNGYAFKSSGFINEGIPLIRISNIKFSGEIDLTNSVKLPLNYKSKYASFLIKKGDILIAMSGATTGKTGLYSLDHEALLNQRVGKFELDSKSVNTNYLNYLVTYISSEVLNKAKGMAQPNISSKTIESIRISLPPLSEQKRIVEKIEKLFVKIDETKRLRSEALSASESILPSAMHQVFSRAEKENWPTKKLGEVIELHYGKGIPKHDRKQNGKYSIYGANGELGRTDKYLVEGEGIIVGRKGSAGEVTRVSGRFWPSDVTYYVFSNEKINIDFLFYVLKQLDLKQLATGIKPGINRNKVYDLEFPLPPIAEQRKIVSYLDSLSKKTQELVNYQKSQLKDLEQLKQSILDKAFKGKL